MRFSIRITSKAIEDIRKAAAYIREDLLNPVAADHLLDHVTERFSSLSDMPEIQQLAADPVLRDKGIRFITIDNYIAFYRIDNESRIVYVLRFQYGKRNWLDILRGDSDPAPDQPSSPSI